MTRLNRRLKAAGGTDRPLIVPKALTNLVTNGDFSNGTTGVSGSIGATVAASNGVLTCTANGTSGAPSAGFPISAQQELGRKIYMKALARVTSAGGVSLYFVLKNDSGTDISAAAGIISSPVANNKYGMSTVLSVSSLVASGIVAHLRYAWADAATANGKVMEVQYVLALDLTALFGAGKEPSAWQMDMWLKDYDPTKRWFDGTKTLNLNYSTKRLTNLVQNGNFALGTQGWAGAQAAGFTAIGEIAEFTASAQYGSIKQSVTCAVGDIMYAAAYIKATSASVGLSATAGQFKKMHPGNGEFVWLSHRRDATSTAVYCIVQDDRASTWDKVYISKLVWLNLTKIFGAGNEPTAAQMDAILARVSGDSWFDGDTLIPISWTYAFNGQSSVSLVNLVTNGDFSNGTTGWFGTAANVAASNGALSVIATSQYGGAVSQNGTTAQNRKVYFAGKVKSDTNLVRLTLANAVSPFTTLGFIAHSGGGAYEFLSGIATITDATTAVRIVTQDRRASDWTTHFIDDLIMIDLTAVFGAGKEPSKEEMDLLMAAVDPVNKWFSGTRVLEGNLNPLAGSALSAITRRESRLSTGGGGIAARDNIVTDGLVLWLDGRDFTNQPNDTVWMDRSPYGNHATASGLAYTMLSGSDRQGGVKFDGVDDYFNVADHSSLDFGYGDFTIFAKFKRDTIGTVQVLIDKRTSEYIGVSLFFLGDNRMHTRLGNSTNGLNSAPIADANWHRVAVRQIRKTESTMFVDGVLVDTEVFDSSAIDISNNNNLKIGIDYVGTQYRTTCAIQSILLYNRALSDAELAQIDRALMA